MMDYYDIYLRRLNRYGTDYQSRLQNQRAKEFGLYLVRSVYRIDFDYEGELVAGTLEPYKQDETQTLSYLLTRLETNIPGGTVLQLPDKDNQLKPWMVYYLENMKASGYNRYILLKMTHYLTWKARDGSEQHSWAYMYGQEDNMLKDEIRSRSRMDTLYGENLKMSFFVMPKNEFIKKEIYLEIGEDSFKEGYVVTGYDLNSTSGVEYVTVDPTYLYDNSEPPVQTAEDKDEDFYWLDGGAE